MSFSSSSSSSSSSLNSITSLHSSFLALPISLLILIFHHCNSYSLLSLRTTHFYLRTHISTPITWQYAIHTPYLTSLQSLLRLVQGTQDPITSIKRVGVQYITDVDVDVAKSIENVELNTDMEMQRSNISLLNLQIEEEKTEIPIEKKKESNDHVTMNNQQQIVADGSINQYKSILSSSSSASIYHAPLYYLRSLSLPPDWRSITDAEFGHITINFPHLTSLEISNCIHLMASALLVIIQRDDMVDDNSTTNAEIVSSTNLLPRPSLSSLVFPNHNFMSGDQCQDIWTTHRNTLTSLSFGRTDIIRNLMDFQLLKLLRKLDLSKVNDIQDFSVKFLEFNARCSDRVDMIWPQLETILLNNQTNYNNHVFNFDLVSFRYLPALKWLRCCAGTKITDEEVETFCHRSSLCYNSLTRLEIPSYYRKLYNCFSSLHLPNLIHLFLDLSDVSCDKLMRKFPLQLAAQLTVLNLGKYTFEIPSNCISFCKLLANGTLRSLTSLDMSRFTGGPNDLIEMERIFTQPNAYSCALSSTTSDTDSSLHLIPHLITLITPVRLHPTRSLIFLTSPYFSRLESLSIVAANSSISPIELFLPSLTYLSIDTDPCIFSHSPLRHLRLSSYNLSNSKLNSLLSIFPRLLSVSLFLQERTNSDLVIHILSQWRYLERVELYNNSACLRETSLDMLYQYTNDELSCMELDDVKEQFNAAELQEVTSYEAKWGESLNNNLMYFSWHQKSQLPDFQRAEYRNQFAEEDLIQMSTSTLFPLHFPLFPALNYLQLSHQVSTYTTNTIKKIRTTRPFLDILVLGI